MKTIPFTTLESERLILREPGPADVPAIVRHAGDPRVALKTTAMPHPYFQSHAREWLGTIREEHARGDAFTYAIERKTEPGMIGVISMTLREDRCSAEIGYWLGVRHWRRGIMTEALRQILRHGFDELGLLYLTANHMAGNPASGRVMEKAGMKFENVVHGGLIRGNTAHDRVNFGLFADEWRDHQT